MSRPLRVLRLISHLGGGGTETQCVEVLRAFAAQPDAHNLEVELATFWSKPHLHRAPESIAWHRLERGEGAAAAARTAFDLARLLRRRRYDVVHALLWPAAALALPLLPRQTALLTSIHSSEIRTRPGKAAVLRAIGLRSDLLVFNNHPGVESLRGRFGTLASNCRVVPNGKRPLPAARVEGSRREGTIMVARCVDSKRQDLLIDAWSELGDEAPAPLRFVGRGTDAPEFLRRARAVGADGLGERDDVDELLLRSQIATLATDHEGMPNAVLEGWNAGACVLASRVPGVRELVRDEVDALLVENDPRAWAAALRHVGRNPELRSRLATRGRARLVEEFSLETTAARWAELYHDAARGRRRG